MQRASSLRRAPKYLLPEAHARRARAAMCRARTARLHGAALRCQHRREHALARGVRRASERASAPARSVRFQSHPGPWRCNAAPGQAGAQRAARAKAGWRATCGTPLAPWGTLCARAGRGASRSACKSAMAHDVRRTSGALARAARCRGCLLPRRSPFLSASEPAWLMPDIRACPRRRLPKRRYFCYGEAQGPKHRC